MRILTVMNIRWHNINSPIKVSADIAKVYRNTVDTRFELIIRRYTIYYITISIFC